MSKPVAGNRGAFKICWRVARAFHLFVVIAQQITLPSTVFLRGQGGQDPLSGGRNNSRGISNCVVCHAFHLLIPSLNAKNLPVPAKTQAAVESYQSKEPITESFTALYAARAAARTGRTVGHGPLRSDGDTTLYGAAAGTDVAGGAVTTGATGLAWAGVVWGAG
jgi:hypothetical protein